MKNNDSKFIFIAAPAKFKLVYQNSKGEVKNYITTPIETFPDGFVGYVFGGKGIKRFNNDSILEIEKSV